MFWASFYQTQDMGNIPPEKRGVPVAGSQTHQKVILVFSIAVIQL